MRLLSDQAFNDEFDVVVDEIAIRYVAGEFAGEEKEQVENYFLRTPERQNKVRVMSELLHHSAMTRAEKATVDTPVQVVPPMPAPAGDAGFFVRVGSLWRSQPLVSAVATFAMLVVVASFVYLVQTGGLTPQPYTFALTSSNVERAPGDSTEPKSIRIPAGTTELHIQLLLSPQQTQPKSYRAEFVAPATPRDLPIVSHDAQSVVVAVPATNLKPDRYAIRLYAVLDDGREERVSGSFMFRVE